MFCRLPVRQQWAHQRFSALALKAVAGIANMLNIYRYANTMPPKAKRNFTVDADTGEVRCKDPCCQVTQCGQCNIEQNARKRAARRVKNQAAAAKQKAAEEQAAIDQASAASAAGKVHNWTYSVERDEEGDEVMVRLHVSDSEKVEIGEGLPSGGGDQEGTQNAVDAEAFQCEKSRGKTTWNHCNRTLLFNCIAKFNPFAAQVKKDAWNTIAVEMAQCTALMNDPKTGDFRVKTDGHGLEVFYARRVEDMNKKISQESTLSGQAGAAITKEQQVEFATLQACVAKEKDAAFIRDNKRRSKSALEEIRNKKVTQLVKDAALEDPVVKQRAFKLLQTKVRAAKLEASVWEKQHGGLGKYSYNQAQLADIEYFTQLKKDFPDESDALPESDGVGDKKKGGVAQAIGELIAKLPTLAPPSIDANQFAQAFFQAKMQHEGQAVPVSGKRTLAQRLADLEAQYADNVITMAERNHYATEIKKAYFMQE